MALESRPIPELTGQAAIDFHETQNLIFLTKQPQNPISHPPPNLIIYPHKEVMRLVCVWGFARY
jgi:hypothetical protein